MTTEVTAPGWYPDPAGQYRLRYWEGDAWSTFVAVGTEAVERPLPTPVTDLPARSAWFGLVGFLVSGVVAGVAAGPIDSLTWSVVVGAAVFWGGLAATLRLVSDRYGTGSMRRDFGFSVKWVDLAGGLGAGIAARAAGFAAAVVIFAVLDDDVESSGGQFDVVEANDTALYVSLCLAVLGAPIIEELFFRGFLQRAFESVIGIAGALVVQAVLFGFAHFTLEGTGTENLLIVVVTGIAGLVLGLAYKLSGRLGPAIVGHGLFNLVAAITILATR